nr:Rrf2 family transcriptional regulator [uncultured Cohaesibacter sp.]
MPTDSRLPRVLHVLLHLDEAEDPVTSDKIGQMLNTNPSLVRRMMAGLRKSGFVASTKGHHGGWYLTRKLDEISLADVYTALGHPNLFSIGPSEDAPTCLLEKSANAATAKALDMARQEFLRELQNVTVADLVDGVRETIADYQLAHGLMDAGSDN